MNEEPRSPLTTSRSVIWRSRFFGPPSGTRQSESGSRTDI